MKQISFGTSHTHASEATTISHPSTLCFSSYQRGYYETTVIRFPPRLQSLAPDNERSPRNLFEVN